MPRGTELPNSLRPIVEADLENGSPLFFLVPRFALKIIVHRAPRQDASHRRTNISRPRLYRNGDMNEGEAKGTESRDTLQ